MTYKVELAEALGAATEAGEIQRAFESNPPEIDRKQDRSPVTEVDLRCEELIRSRLLKKFSGDGFMGEESETETGTSGRRWIVDPLDGTRPFLRGIPTYSVLIALEEDSEPVLGVIHLPALGLNCWATKGNGAFLNGKPICVSGTSALGAGMGSALGFVEKAGAPEGRKLLSLMQAWDYAYGFMDAYSYVLVASGSLDLAVNLLDKPWDCASAACIVREAGGRFSDINGKETVHSGSIVLSNGVLHDDVLKYFI
ncbi:MAG: hypothetical protein MUF22_09560 [Chitinispirillaceae bacterium]|jgi:histidinol phosphatase-like enzyme (inositol monophosphatase family)|nr:hypothetical protein [Chitinispirillaceae bacterium]